MRTIFKYTLELTDIQRVAMPKDAIILSVQVQRNCLRLWAEVESRNPPEERTIEINGTGNIIDMRNTRSFIGTVQLSDYVWHIYERTTNN